METLDEPGGTQIRAATQKIDLKFTKNGPSMNLISPKKMIKEGPNNCWKIYLFVINFLHVVFSQNMDFYHSSHEKRYTVVINCFCIVLAKICTFIVVFMKKIKINWIWTENGQNIENFCKKVYDINFVFIV